MAEFRLRARGFGRILRRNAKGTAMYTPAHFMIEELDQAFAAIRAARLATLASFGTDGLIATPLPLLLDETEGEFGVLFGHIARANPHWQAEAAGESMAIFMGPDAYVTPSWYPTKAKTGAVVPTWNYVAIHAYGVVEFFHDEERLHRLVSRLTDRHESGRAAPWKVDDAPEPFVKAQLRAIVGVRMPITRIDAKRKMSQNRNEEDRAGVARGLAQSADSLDRDVGALVEKLSR